MNEKNHQKIHFNLLQYNHEPKFNKRAMMEFWINFWNHIATGLNINVGTKNSFRSHVTDCRHFPFFMKLSSIVQILKVGDSAEPSCNNPISRSKLHDDAMSSPRMSLLERFNLLYSNQLVFGFHCSILDAIAKMSEKISTVNPYQNLSIS